MGNEGSEPTGLSALPDDLADELVDKIVSSAMEDLLAGDDADNGLVEELADEIVTEFNKRNPDLTRKSRPVLEALSDFTEEKLEDLESKSQYRTKIQYIQIYLDEEVAAKTTDDLTSEDIQGYKKWRKNESLDREEPLANSTLSDDMYLFGEFVEYMIKHGMVPVRFTRSVDIPEIDYANGEGVDDKQLDPEVANAALDHLRKFEYGSVDHVAMELYCHSGPRKGEVHSLDKDDFDYDDRVLDIKNRDDTGLKNDEDSAREVDLYGEVPEIINDYIDRIRPSVTGENGREPLLVGDGERIHPSTLQKIAYKWSRPCVVGLDCPHDRDPEECEAAQKNNAAYKCPSSRAPHHIRSGYITDQRNRGVSSDAIDHRCNVSKRVQDRHYDQPEASDERERHSDEFKSADDDPDSGYNH